MTRAVIGVLLASALLLAGCTTTGGDDRDGLEREIEEVQGWSVTVRYPDHSEETYVVHSDPTLPDTDGDGLNDFVEFQAGTDPTRIDTDRDGLLDGPELCPEDGSDLLSRIQQEGIIEHPGKPGCFVGEDRWELDGVVIRTKATDAHSDDGSGIGDGIPDGEEILGWQVALAGGATYHTFSNPSTRSPDTDGDGLHDGLELELGLDPRKADTDGDGTGDQSDAAPLGNLIVTFTLDRITLKTDKQVTGGADLIVEGAIGQQGEQTGPRAISKGQNEVGMELVFDVPDEASSLEGGSGAGHWQGAFLFSFFHQQSGSDDPIRVKPGEDNGHVLQLTYDAFSDTWRGDASGGTSSGPDADVRISMDSRIE